MKKVVIGGGVGLTSAHQFFLAIGLAPSTSKIFIDLVRGSTARLPHPDLTTLEPNRFSRKARHATGA